MSSPGTITAATVGDGGEGGVSPFDFRQASQCSREALRGIEIAHEVFTRRVSTGWGGVLRAQVGVEPLGVDQVSYDDYMRSMPTPNILGQIDVAPLPGAVVVELTPQLGLTLVDRMLGGRGDLAGRAVHGARRPTELEGVLLAELLRQAAHAIGDTLEQLVSTTTSLTTIEYNPQLVQVAAPSDTVLLLSYRLTATQGVDAEGLLTVCYPLETLGPILEHLSTGDRSDERALTAGSPVLADRLRDVDAELAVCMGATTLSTRDLTSLEVGDVVRLEQRVDEPLRGRIGAVDVLDGHVGRRGRRLALQVRSWLAENPAEAINPLAETPDPERSA